MGRTSKVAKTHKSPFSFSSRSKKHFLRFSNRKKKETHVDRGTPSSIQMDFTLSKPETLLQPPSHVKLCVGRGEKYSVSLQQENRLTETCVCVCRRADHAPSPAVMHFSGIPSFTAVPDGFQKGKRKKKEKEIQSCCLCVLCGMSVEATGVLWW